MSSKTNHSPARRAEASADPRIRSTQQLDLSDCADGINTWGKWTPVRGPHIKVIRTRFSTNRTGVPGISYGVGRIRRKNGTHRIRHYFIANLGNTSRKFCIESQGSNEAWRRAIKCRAEHELRIRQINATILSARKSNS